MDHGTQLTTLQVHGCVPGTAASAVLERERAVPVRSSGKVMESWCTFASAWSTEKMYTMRAVSAVLPAAFASRSPTEAGKMERELRQLRMATHVVYSVVKGRGALCDALQRIRHPDVTQTLKTVASFHGDDPSIPLPRLTRLTPLTAPPPGVALLACWLDVYLPALRKVSVSGVELEALQHLAQEA
ncbi:hypothetical protein FB451DRAFT_1172295 [Mycena latifolia]|nr:hypothetical protein FB451DRAFT_1172295 [Mycena latifolia]